MNGINNFIPQNLIKLEPAVRDIMNDVEPEIIMLCRFGSHLYGTDTPTSDTDYKGIFIPTKHMILMGNIPKSINNNQRKPEGQKNTKDDVDFELYSLHYFIQMACNGDTAAMDMLHVNKPNLLISSDIWEKIESSRSMFYTKNLSAFAKYARRQAAKYGVKGSRLNIAKEFIRIVSEESDHEAKLKTIWDKLPIGVHSRYVETNPNGVRQYQICGKILQETITLAYAQETISLFHKKYGERAKKAATNEGVDWKAVSHAIRAAYQIKEIYTDRTITFPLKKADYIRKVKMGELDFTTQVQPKLEKLIAALELYTDRSTLPEEVDKQHWEWFVASTINKYVVSRTFNIGITELYKACHFAKEFGEGPYDTISMRVTVGNVGDNFTVFTDEREEDITDTDNW